MCDRVAFVRLNVIIITFCDEDEILSKFPYPNLHACNVPRALLMVEKVWRSVMGGKKLLV